MLQLYHTKAQIAMGSVKLKRGRQNVVPFCVVLLFFLTHVVCFWRCFAKNEGYFTSLPSARWKEHLGDQVAIGSIPQRGSFLLV